MPRATRRGLRTSRRSKALAPQPRDAPSMGRINEVVRMIVQESIQDGKPLPEGPLDSVEVEEVSQQEPASPSPCSPWASTIAASGRSLIDK